MCQAKVTPGGLRYPGDYEFEGRWVGNIPSAGGLLTSRGGHVTANLHRFARTAAMRSVNVPHNFADFDVREDAAESSRSKLHTKTVRDVLETKLLKEAQNIA